VRLVGYLKRKKYLLTYLLTPSSRDLLEKLTGFQLVKKFPAFYVTRRFITAFTSVRHLSLSWPRFIQSIHPHPTSWRSILIISSHLRLGFPSDLFPFSLLRLHQSISPGARLTLWLFLNKMRFYSEELLTPHSTPKLEDHPLSVLRDCLIDIFAATLHIGGRSSIRNLRTRHAVVTGTHLSRTSTVFQD